MVNIDLMGYMPDPHEQIQVVPIVRGHNIWFQIVDQDSGQTFVLNFMTAIKMAGQISYLSGRIHEDMINAALDQMGPSGWEEITRAADDPTDERFQRETYRRPKN